MQTRIVCTYSTRTLTAYGYILFFESGIEKVNVIFSLPVFNQKGERKITFANHVVPLIPSILTILRIESRKKRNYVTNRQTEENHA